MAPSPDSIDDTAAERAVGHRSAAQLAAAIHDVEASPVGRGILKLIVRRPSVGTREVLDSAELTVADGLVGDSWKQRPSSRTADHSPHPDMQLNVMNWRAITALTGDADHDVALAGDQLYVDLALDDHSLPPWTRLAIGAERGGTAIIAVTDQPHARCAKFSKRFGADARRWVNSDDGIRLHLGGINAKVIAPGAIRSGDEVTIVD